MDAQIDTTLQSALQPQPPFSLAARRKFEAYIQSSGNRFLLREHQYGMLKYYLENPEAICKTKKEMRMRWVSRNNYSFLDGQLYRKSDDTHPEPRYCVQITEIFDVICRQHAQQLGHAGRDKTWKEIDRLYYGITKAEVRWLLPHCSTCAKARRIQNIAPLEPILASYVWERIQIDLIDFWHHQQHFLWCLHIRDHFSKFSVAYPLPSKESVWVAHYLALFISQFGVHEILQCDNGTEFKGACEALLRIYGITMVHSRSRSPQTNGLIEQANAVLKAKIQAWMQDHQSDAWWMAIPEAILAMNRQVHGSTKKSSYEVVFLRWMSDKIIASNLDRQFMDVLEEVHDYDDDDESPETFSVDIARLEGPRSPSDEPSNTPVDDTSNPASAPVAQEITSETEESDCIDPILRQLRQEQLSSKIVAESTQKKKQWRPNLRKPVLPTSKLLK